MKTVTLYTDGACSGNPGPGGWGAILSYNGVTKELSGGEDNTTNNRMELTGVIKGLEALKEPCIVELYSDSKYVIDALQKGWAWGWKKRNWVKSDKKPALNPDLWEELLSQMPPAEEAAERFLRARCRNKTVDEALLRKLSAALQRRGFSWQDIQAPLRRLESEIQE